MKQRFYIVIESKKEIEPKDVLFALREARPGWGNMSASLAAQHSVQRTADDLGQLPADQIVKNYNRAVSKSFRRR